MFATATKHFAEKVDPDGDLIPVSSLKDSISVMSVVVKRKKFWLWQKPKYIPTDFKLSDLLTGDAPLTPGEMERWCSVFHPHPALYTIAQTLCNMYLDLFHKFSRTTFYSVRDGEQHFVMSHRDLPPFTLG